ncbi:MAG: sigma-70 family RNA polymerase sigma factor [Anaerolineales bacterium]
MQARQGNQAAWSELVALHQQGIFRMAYLKLADEQEAEEVAQETFVRAFRKLDQFDEERPLRPWLLGICVNLCRNRRRALGRYLAVIRRWSRDRGPDAAQTTGQSMDDDVQLLWSVIKRMDGRDQDIIYYRFFMDLKVAETAEVMGVAPGTVKSRQHRAVERLRGLMQRAAPDWLEDLKG